VEIVAKIEQLHGSEWLQAEGAAHAADFAADRARRMIGSRRREFEIALKPGDEMSQADMKMAGVWIPAVDGLPEWKKAADVTADDLDRKAGWYETFARGALKRAVWCRDVAGMMRAEGVVKLGKLKADLPPLPSEDDLPQLGPA
jgi:hypothetical protein